MVKHRKPPVRHEDSTHVQTLKQKIKHLETTQHSGVAHVVDDFPEIADLMYSASELIEAAQPGSGATWDDSRGNADPISHDGISTSAGRNTYNARRRLDYWRRRCAGMVEAMNNDLDPNSRPVREDRPRHQAKECPGKGRRQPHGTRFCGYCGDPMGTAKPKAKRANRHVSKSTEEPV